MKKTSMKKMFLLLITTSLTGCELLFGPLSTLSLEGAMNGKWEQVDVGEWRGTIYTINTTMVHGIQVYKLKTDPSPQFIVYYLYQETYDYPRYINIQNQNQVDTIDEYVVGSGAIVPTPRLFVESQEKILFCAIDPFDKWRITFYNPSKYSYPAGEEVHKIYSLGDILLYTSPTRVQGLKLNGSPAFGILVSKIPSLASIDNPEVKEKLGVMLLTNENTMTLQFFSQNGAILPEKNLTLPTNGNGVFVRGVGIGESLFLLAQAPTGLRINLWHMTNNQWKSVDSFPIMSLAEIQSLADIIVVGSQALFVATAAGEKTIEIHAYTYTHNSLKKICVQTLSTSDPIEGLDFFYDKVREALLLGVLQNIGDGFKVSYFKLPI